MPPLTTASVARFEFGLFELLFAKCAVPCNFSFAFHWSTTVRANTLQLPMEGQPDCACAGVLAHTRSVRSRPDRDRRLPRSAAPNDCPINSRRFAAVIGRLVRYNNGVILCGRARLERARHMYSAFASYSPLHCIVSGVARTVCVCDSRHVNSAFSTAGKLQERLVRERAVFV